MYSIKGRPTHVKGVKVGSVRHDQMLKAMIEKDEVLKIDSIQFAKKEYEIHLHTLTKKYMLRRDDKRLWYYDKER